MASKDIVMADAFTENSAVSFSQTGNALVNLLFKMVRGLNQQTLNNLLQASWEQSPLDTLKIIFQCRDCRGGKGERAIFVNSMQWLAENHLETALKNLKHVPFFGSWKDVVSLINIPKLSSAAVKMVANQLKEDLAKIQADPKASISLASKWAPTEKHAHDKAYRAASLIAEELFPKDNKKREKYRKQYISPLRKHLAVIERFMCSGAWGRIPYSSVPSRCMNLSRNAFQKHDQARFSKFLSDVASGKTTIKGKQMFPHELVNAYFNSAGHDVDEVVELQWDVVVKEVKKHGALSDCLVVSDVSGSMSGTPMQVSVALGLLISEVAAPPFTNLVITFHDQPTFFTVQGDTLRQRVRSLLAAPWGGTTNFQAVFRMILERAKENNVPPDQLPKRVFVISDMQFNQAGNLTNHAAIEEQYRAAGYPMPTLIYWNVRANTMDFPSTANTPGVAMVSGFSPSLLKAFIENNANDFSPLIIVRQLIDDPRYNVLEL